MDKNPAAPVLTVIGPVYNEEGGILEFHRRLSLALDLLELSSEIIYVDDGSSDKTPEILRRLARQDKRVKLLHLSRNFGHQIAITAGLDHAEGSACVVMDTDGQDPPEVLPELLAAWRRGNEVVYAVRLRREAEGLFKRLTAAVFYRLMRGITQVRIPLDAGDFRLMDRGVVQVLRQMRETHRFMRGLTSWVGFRQAKVEYVRRARVSGKTHYPLFKMIHFALDGITSFSYQPLRWVTYCGLLSFLLSVGIGLWALYTRFLTDNAVRGWTSLMGVALLLGGVQLVSLGIMGEYLGRIFDEVKRRPLYALRDAVGFDSPRVIGSKFPDAAHRLRREEE